MIVKAKKLGIAAYLKSKGCTFLSMEGRSFVFESPKSMEEWTIEYTNSCCYRHDSEVCTLRKILTEGVS